MEAVWAGACCPKFCPVLKLGTAVFCEGKSKASASAGVTSCVFKGTRSSTRPSQVLLVIEAALARAQGQRQVTCCATLFRCSVCLVSSKQAQAATPARARFAQLR